MCSTFCLPIQKPKRYAKNGKHTGHTGQGDNVAH